MVRSRNGQPLKPSSPLETVDGWFNTFRAEHCSRCLRNDYPEDPKVAHAFWDGWRIRFKLWGMTMDLATHASVLVASEDLYPNQQLKAMMAFATSLRKKQEKEHEAEIYLDRDKAREDTPPYCECSRDGIVFRFRHQSVRDGRGTDAAGTRYACHCLCPMGQWMRQTLDDKNRRYFTNLARFPALQLGPVPWSRDWDNQYCYHPDDWNETAGEPFPIESNWLEMVQLLRSQGGQAVAARMKQEVPRPYIPRRPRVEPAAYREPTPEETARAEKWKQQHFPAAPANQEAPAF